MGTKLVTIAAFDQVVQARMAADTLRAAGIDATVADAELVSMDWLLGPAVGGIKVQVRDEDADRAVAELNQSFGEDGAGLGVAAPPPAGEPVPEVTTDEDDRPVPVPDFRMEPEDQIPPPPDPYSRDGYARRAALVVWLTGLLPPAWFLAVYFVLNAAFGEGALSPRGRFHLFLAVLAITLMPPALFLFALLIGLFQWA
jgi:hypothetical protein